MDFFNEVYTVDGVSVAITDLIDSNGFFGPFDASRILAGTGLRAPVEGGFIGPALDTFLAGTSVRWDMTTASGLTPRLEVQIFDDPAFTTGLTIDVQVDPSTQTKIADFDDIFDHLPGMTATGVNNANMTLSTTNMALSVNGVTTTAKANPRIDVPADAVGFSLATTSATVITKIRMYAPVSDADLPTLGAEPIGAGIAAGIGEALAVSVSTTASVGASSGTGAATAVGVSTVASAGAASGVGAASAPSDSGVAIGSASGTGAASAVGALTAASAGAASGVGDAPAVGTAVGDPSFASVKLLLDMQGTNNGTTFTDLSSSAHTMTVSGTNTHTDTSQFKFGTSSAKFDGTDDVLAVESSSSDWDQGTAFTYEGWYMFNSTSGDQVLFSNGANPGGNGAFLRYTGGSLDWFNWSSGGHFSNSWSPSTGVWYHLAISRDGTTCRMFIDGVAQATTSTASQTLSGSTFYRLGLQGGSSRPFNGWIGAYRWTKGVGRYSSNFTPPTTAFPTS
jgi:hypothetical protein